MKIANLKRNIAINASTAFFLLIIFIILFWKFNNYQQDSQDEIQKIKSSTQELKNKTSELEGKISEAKKYKEIWKKIDDNKKSTQNIKMDDVNKVLKDMADKYNIQDQQIEVILPIEIKNGIFDRSSISTFFSSGKLSFKASEDVSALLFIKDFFANLQGYIIPKSINIKKNRNYTNQDLIDLSNGRTANLVDVKVEFSWYSYRDKVK